MLIPAVAWWLMAISLVLVLAYRHVSLMGWTVTIGLFLAAWTVWGDVAMAPLTIVWGLFVFHAAVLNVKPIRRFVFSTWLFRLYRKMLPAMSATEREAIEAGNVWWDADLFSGAPDWQRLRAFKRPTLTDEEQAFLDGPVETLCQMVNDWQVTHELRDLPPEVWDYIRSNGFFGMIIPKRYGGLEFSAWAHSQVVLKICSRSLSAGISVMVPNSLGPGELLLHYGTREQKDYYLPRLARGEEIPCFALTGPDAGSDAAAMPDNGIVCRGTFDGRDDVLGIRLNWSKRYITLGPVATLLGLAFKLYDPDALLGEQRDLGITLALIPTDTPGVSIGRRHFPLNSAFQNGPNSGKDVFIPLDWVIGGPDGVGQGWRMLMECLAVGRSISLPAVGTSAGKWVARTVGAYARIRKQFNMSVGNFGGVEEALARIGGYVYMMDAARTMTLGGLDDGEKPSVISAIIKYHLTERMRDVVNDGMDILGGKGISMGPNNFLARPYQSLPIGITVEGANILTRSMIIFGQGAIRCHPYVLKEMLAAAETDERKGLCAFDDAIFAHIGFVISNVVRSVLLGLSGGHLARVSAGAPARRYYQQLTRLSSVFALTADLSMLVLGGSLKRREKLSARLGDMLSELYLASATLKRFEDQGRPKDDEVLLRWACEHSLYRFQDQLEALLRNFPNRFVAWGLHLIAMPFGRTYRGPSDQLGRRVAQLLMSPSHARDRLTAGIYAPDDLSEVTGQLEEALRRTIGVEPIEKKLHRALRSGELDPFPLESRLERAVDADIIDEREAAAVRAAEQARLQIINVDDFSPEELAGEEKQWQQRTEQVQAERSM